MRQIHVAPASYAPCLNATAGMTVSELDANAATRKAWGASKQDGRRCATIVFEEGVDTLGQLIQQLLLAGLITIPESVEATPEKIPA